MRLLAVTPNWLGDMVMSASLLQALKAELPDLHITTLAPAFARPVLERMPVVDNCIDSPFGHGGLQWSARRQFARTLPDFDAALVLPNSFKSALIPWMAGIPRRVGWRGEFRFGVLTHHRPLVRPEFPLMVDRYRALAEHFGVQPGDQQPRLRALNPNPVDPDLLILAPGAAFGSAKRWPADRFGQVALAALSQGKRVILIGGPDEQADCEKIATMQPPAYQSKIQSLAGQISLGESIDLMATAGQVVANDSGLMHIAAALGVPVVGLFGPTSPEHTPPLSDQAQVIWSRPACAPCFKRQCPLAHHECMKTLAPAQVIEVLR